MLVLAFDTATAVATTALVRDGEVLGERTSTTATFLADVDRLLVASGHEPSDVTALAVGVGPGSFTGVRIGVSAARALAFALDVPVGGVSTLVALAAGAPGATPVVDAKRGQVFTLVGGQPACIAPSEVRLDAAATCVGDGAVRYRADLEAAGGVVPPNTSEVHVPRARFHAALAAEFGPGEHVAPIYLRPPDADRTRVR